MPTNHSPAPANRDRSPEPDALPAAQRRGSGAGAVPGDGGPAVRDVPNAERHDLAWGV